MIHGTGQQVDILIRRLTNLIDQVKPYVMYLKAARQDWTLSPA